MTVSRASIPLVLAVPAYLTGVAVGTFIATAWNSGDDARGLVRLTARTLHRPPRDVRARMAAVAAQNAALHPAQSEAA
ncbi:hypothetical protein [Nocardioides immobilis]|nr:hypothetical protein [Nocardioides immobilis]